MVLQYVHVYRDGHKLFTQAGGPLAKKFGGNQSTFRVNFLISFLLSNLPVKRARGSWKKFSSQRGAR